MFHIERKVDKWKNMEEFMTNVKSTVNLRKIVKTDVHNYPKNFLVRLLTKKCRRQAKNYRFSRFPHSLL